MSFSKISLFSHFEISIHIKIYKAAYPQVPIQARIQKIFAWSSRDIFVFCGGGGGGWSVPVNANFISFSRGVGGGGGRTFAEKKRGGGAWDA